jgi:apolipoprotein N-acyltransferase
MVWMMREGDGVVMPKLKSVKRGLSDHLSGGTAAMRGALWTAAIYVSLSVWHYLFFHQFLLLALLFAAFELAPTYAHILAFLTVGNTFHSLFGICPTP